MEKSEPGAARFGNFINYYDFNPAATRSKLLEDFLTEHIRSIPGSEPIFLLDVGCNAGDLSLEIHRMASAAVSGERQVHMLAIDLDAVLIERASEKITDPLIQFSPVDITDSRQREVVLSKFLANSKAPRFDLVFCFSTTMWVHLNQGDSGLTDLLKVLCHYGENVVIEPQPWKCYRNAMRRMRRTHNEEFPHFSSLKMRNTVIDDISTFLTKQCSCQLVKHLGYSDWNRPVLWYRTQSVS